jgi:hypothetical protein
LAKFLNFPRFFLNFPAVVFTWNFDEKAREIQNLPQVFKPEKAPSKNKFNVTHNRSPHIF